MQIPSEFDSIRSYEDEEIQGAIDDLFADESFRNHLQKEFHLFPLWVLKLIAKRIKSVQQIQEVFVRPRITHLLKKASDGMTSDIFSTHQDKDNVLYLSNHRDIILDSTLLDYILLTHNKKTTEIGIGDNLLIHSWIEILVRLNRSFIVRRSLTASELLESSKRLSGYIRFVIEQKKSPIWLAQREGRAKDSDDRTQKSVLKMLAMSGEGSIVSRLKSLNIVPLTISYEYDPCDYLKAKEFQLKRDNPAYKKSQNDDMINMKTGISGKKGHIHYQASKPLNEMLDTLDESQPRNQLFDQITGIIDKQIFNGYRFYPGNYIAMDLLRGDESQSHHYSQEDKEQFEEYINTQLSKIDLSTPDWPFLREKILQMYANPLINNLNNKS